MVVAAAEGGLMTTPPVKAPDQGVLLEECLQNEERRLRVMQQERASWFRQWKQRRRIARAQRELDWADTRLMGENPFMWRHGFKAGLAILVMTEIGYWRFPWTPGHHIDIVAAVMLGLFCGGVGGFLSAVFEWDRRETSLRETLAELLPAQPGVTP